MPRYYYIGIPMTEQREPRQKVQKSKCRAAAPSSEVDVTSGANITSSYATDT